MATPILITGLLFQKFYCIFFVIKYIGSPCRSALWLEMASTWTLDWFHIFHWLLQWCTQYKASKLFFLTLVVCFTTQSFHSVNTPGRSVINVGTRPTYRDRGKKHMIFSDCVCVFFIFVLQLIWTTITNISLKYKLIT